MFTSCTSVLNSGQKDMFVVQSCTAVSRTNFAAGITSSIISSSPDYKVGFYQLLGESACPFCNGFSYFILFWGL